MKVIVTGSHFTPAQAVIEQFLQDPKIKIVYLGRSSTLEGDKTPSAESQVLPKLGVKFIPLNAGRLQLMSLPKIPVGFIQAFLYLLEEKPDIVLSFGGYSAVPVVISAWVLSIPVVIHEQTLVTGLANKISSYFADKVCVSFDKRYDLRMDKVVVTGNPMRIGLVNPKVSEVDSELKHFLDSQLNSKLPLVFLTGGNQGAHVINIAIGEILNELIDRAYVIHQTGDSKYQDYESSQGQKKNLDHPERYFITKFLNASEMGLSLQRADLCICRAGINTLLELSYFGVQALVIPISGHHEQSVNAKYFQDLALANILWQSDLTAEKLLSEVRESLKNILRIKTKALAAKIVVRVDAAKSVAIETLSLYQSQQSG